MNPIDMHNEPYDLKKWGKKEGPKMEAVEPSNEDVVFNPFAKFWHSQFEGKQEAFQAFTELFQNLDRVSSSYDSIDEALSHVDHGNIILRSLKAYEKAGGKFPFKTSDKFTAQHLQFLKNALTRSIFG